jgi:hypothetical protein
MKTRTDEYGNPIPVKPTDAEFLSMCAENGIPQHKAEAYLRGAYTPEEWREIWFRYSSD